MMEIIIVFLIATVATFFVGRFVYRTLAGAKTQCDCTKECPLSVHCGMPSSVDADGELSATGGKVILCDLCEAELTSKQDRV